MHPHQFPHHGGGGHIPQSVFSNWGNWGWSQPDVEYYVVENQMPTWVWVAGGALVGMVLAMVTRGR